MKSYVFVTTPKVLIRKEGNRIIFENGAQKKQLPLGIIKSLFIFPAVNITTPALKFLVKNKKNIFFVTSSGKLQALVLNEAFLSNTNIRKKQYDLFFNIYKRIEMTKKLLRAKLDALKKIMFEIGFLSGYESMFLQLEATISKLNSLDSALGIDGNIMRIVYRVLKNNLPSGINFEKRSYYPPEDEVNVVLSIFFTLMYSLLIPILLNEGFDPYVGFFHERRGEHATLSSDLMELKRPDLVILCLKAFQDGIVTRDDFSRKDGNIYLNFDASKKLFVFLSENFLSQDPFKEIIIFLKRLINKEEEKSCENIRSV